MLADIIEAVSGADYRRFVAERICSPLGLPRMQLGVPRDQQGDIAELLSVGVPLSAAEWKEATGVDGLNLGEVTQDNLVALHHPAALEVGHPGGGLVSTAADLARFYQALLHNPGELWDPAILADATSHIRHTMRDDTLMVVANRTLGLMVVGDDDLAAWRGMGRTASPRDVRPQRRRRRDRMGRPRYRPVVLLCHQRSRRQPAPPRPPRRRPQQPRRRNRPHWR